jgi:hypothetical protein
MHGLRIIISRIICYRGLALWKQFEGEPRTHGGEKCAKSYAAVNIYTHRHKFAAVKRQICANQGQRFSIGVTYFKTAVPYNR